MSNESLQELIEALKKQGVENGEEAGRQIVETARQEAESIRSAAAKEAAAIIAQARTDSEKELKKLQAAMEIAASQFLNQLKGILEHDFLTLPLKERIGREFGDPQFLKTLLTEFVKTYAAAPGRGAIRLLLPESAGADLRDFAVDLMVRHYGPADGSGTLVRTIEASGVKFGFQADVQDGHVRLDFTDEAFLALFNEFLSPQFRTLFTKNKIK